MRISFILGLILAFPYIFYEFWKFVAPALYPKERKVARGTVFATAFLFLLGVIFGYYILIPLSIHFLNTYIVSTQVLNQINLASYISTISMLALASGIVFELPMLMYFLTKIGIITPSFLRKYRRHSIVVIFIIAAIITPPDVFSQTLVALPLLLLYEVGIFISAAVYKKKQAAAV
jgi:sec-independent protein translocase protein TatC